MRRFVFTMMIISVLIITGCQQGGNGGRTKVVFWHVMGGPTGDALKALIDSFNTMNPDMEVIPISVGNYNALSQKIMASIQNPPVMSQMYESWTMELYEADRLEPIESMLDAEELDAIKADMFDVFVKDNTFHGVMVSLPFNKSVPAYFYNKDRFSEYGMESFPDNWDDFFAAMRKLTVDMDNDGNIDMYGTAFNINTWMFESRLLQFNGQLVDENMQPMFNSPAALKAIDIDRQMLNRDKTAYITTGYQHQDDFIAGKISTIFGSCVSLSFILDAQPPFELGVAPVPSGDRDAVLISGTNVSVFKKATDEEKAAALRFIKWFISPDIQAIWSEKTGYLPVMESSLENERLLSQFEKFPGLKSVYEQLNYAFMEPQANEWYLGRQILGESLEYIIKGNRDALKTLNEAAEEFRKELK